MPGEGGSGGGTQGGQNLDPRNFGLVPRVETRQKDQRKGKSSIAEVQTIGRGEKKPRRSTHKIGHEKNKDPEKRSHKRSRKQKGQVKQTFKNRKKVKRVQKK